MGLFVNADSSVGPDITTTSQHHGMGWAHSTREREDTRPRWRDVIIRKFQISNLPRFLMFSPGRKLVKKQKTAMHLPATEVEGIQRAGPQMAP